jgi:TfoX/Sxy family transcriptional regulator of competence genes
MANDQKNDQEDDQKLVASVRAALAGTGVIREVRMFGGIGFMLNGNLVAAASRRGLLLRVGKDRQAEALAQSGARPMVMRGRAMEGYVYVDPPALNKQAVQNWLRPAVAYVQTLPRKPDRKPKQRKGKRT